jgi:hypothetical protein
MPRGVPGSGKRPRQPQPRAPILIEGLLKSGKKFVLEGWSFENDGTFVKVQVGMGAYEWLALDVIERMTVSGLPIQTAQPVFRNQSSVDVTSSTVTMGDDTGPPVEYVARKNRIPRARMLPPDRSLGPSSVVENPDGTAETIGAAFIK